MSYQLPTYSSGVRPRFTEGVKIGGQTIASMRHTSNVEAAAMESINRSVRQLGNTISEHKQEQRQAVLADQLSNFQVGVFSAIEGHFDALRDNPDAETYQENLSTTIDNIRNELLPQVTDPEGQAVASRFFDMQVARAHKRTEETADEVRLDIRQANLEKNLQESIRIGRIDRIEPLIAGARAGNTISAKHAESLRTRYMEAAQKDNYKKLKDAYLGAAQEMGYENGVKWLMNPKNTPGLAAKDRQELQSSANVSFNMQKAMEAEELTITREKDRDAIYKAIDTGTVSYEMIDKSSLNETEQKNIRNYALTKYKDELQESERDTIYKAIEDGTFTVDMVDKSSLNETEQKNIRQLNEDTKKARNEAKELPFKKSDNATKLKLQRDIEAGKKIPADDIYALVGKKLSFSDAKILVNDMKVIQSIKANPRELELLRRIDTGKQISSGEIYDSVGDGITIETARGLVTRLKTRKETPYGQTVQFLLDDLKDLGKAGYFIYGADQKEADSRDDKYNALDAEQRLKNQKIYTAIYRDFTQWLDNTPDATDLQKREKYQSLVEPGQNEIALGWWRRKLTSADDEQDVRNKRQWEKIEVKNDTDALSEINKLPAEYKGIWQQAESEGATPQEFLDEVKSTWFGSSK